jgi:hypothetical protein
VLELSFTGGAPGVLSVLLPTDPTRPT